MHPPQRRPCPSCARVAGLVAGGGYAEYGLVHEDHALEIPKNISFTEAAALPETIYTVWANVFELGGLSAGQTLLVHGGSSGIGTTAIQMAKHFGAIVASTAGTDEKCDFCEKLGADLTINYKNTDFEAAIATLTDGQGANLILDIVGGSYFQRNIAAAARGGRRARLRGGDRPRRGRGAGVGDAGGGGAARASARACDL
mgnify:CR=1 FL=1